MRSISRILPKVKLIQGAAKVLPGNVVEGCVKVPEG
jgi:hypothetical protein